MSEENRKQLSEEARLKRNEYTRNWRKAHPEKRKEYQRRFWEKQAAKDRQDDSESSSGEAAEE